MGTLLDRAVERLTGFTADTLRDVPLSEWRLRAEARAKKPTVFTSIFPIIGRGNVMRDHFISHEEVNRRFDAAFRP